jgi:glycosyltransferase involved in cell wall biosynthesis
MAPEIRELESPPERAQSVLAGLRILVVHEWLYTWAGSERCLEEILRIVPHADVVAGIVTDGIRTRQPITQRAVETWLGLLPGARRFHRWFLPLHPLAFASVDTSKYDLVLSLSHAFAKVVRKSAGSVHVCYCFSPPRYLWDLRTTYGNHAPLAQRLALTLAAAPLRAVDRFGAAGVDRFISISRCVADRVRRSYGRDSAVVYPPVVAKSAGIAQSERPFLLSLGRLVPYKRVDLAIRAAELLRMKLVVAGDGPDRARLEKLAGTYTEFVGEVSEQEAGRLLSSCRAFVFCAEEDFGIAPVEANAHGVPVVAFARGAATETMVDGKTGVFFHRQEERDVADAIERCLSAEWDTDTLRNNADRFSPERFRHGMTEQLLSAVQSVARGVRS